MKSSARSGQPLWVRVGVGMALGVIAIGAVVVRMDPEWVAWVFLAVALAGLLVLGVGQRTSPGEPGEEQLLETVREAIRCEAERLDARRAQMEKTLIAYGEWMEFPDYAELRETDWAVSGRSALDMEVAQLLDVETTRMMERFSTGVYWEGGTFDSRMLLTDLLDFMEAIAKVYRPDSPKPFLETNLESMFKAINRVSLQVILLLEEMPIVDAQEWNLRKVSNGVRRASKVYQKYERARPFLNPARYLWHGSKFLLAANPLAAAGWIAGAELAWKGGKALGNKAANAYLLTLLRQTLSIVAWETASIFDSAHRFRNPDFVYGVELAHLVSQFPMDRETLRGVLRELGRIPFHSTFDRVFLYRCVAQQVSPKPERFCQADLMGLDVREAILDQLVNFLDKHLEEAPEKKIAKWKTGVQKRLQIDLH